MFSFFCRAAPVVRTSSEVTSVRLLSLIFSRPLYRKTTCFAPAVIESAGGSATSKAAFIYKSLLLSYSTAASSNNKDFSVSGCLSQLLPTFSFPAHLQCLLQPHSSAVHEVDFWFSSLGGHRTTVCVQR